MTEEWKIVATSDRKYYEVSNEGRVRSTVCSIGRTRILRMAQLSNGYLGVCINGRHHLVHRLVMLAFVGDSELKVDHLNGAKDDNRLSNLEYVTQRENSCRGKGCDKKPSLKSKFRGVNPLKSGFRANKRIDGKCVYLGTYDNEIDASEAYDLGVKTSNAREPNPIGCHFNETKKSWVAYYKRSGKVIYLGHYHNMEDAMEAYRLRKKTDKSKSKGSRPINGFVITTKFNSFRAGINTGSGMKWLGTFKTKEMADISIESFKQLTTYKENA